MDTKELEQQVHRLTAALAVIQMQQMITRIFTLVLAETHPDKAALIAAFEKRAEHAIADTLTRTYPDGVVDLIQKDLEELKATLHEIAQAKNQDSQKR